MFSCVGCVQLPLNKVERTSSAQPDSHLQAEEPVKAPAGAQVCLPLRRRREACVALVPSVLCNCTHIHIRPTLPSVLWSG